MLYVVLYLFILVHVVHFWDPHLVDAAVTFANDVVVVMEGTRSGYFYKE